MIGTSLAEYLFIRASLIPLRYSTPLAALGLGLTLLLLPSSPAATAASYAFGALLLAEALFGALVYLPYSRRLRREAKYPPPLTRPEREALLAKCLANIPHPELYMRMWFLGADLREIKRDNVREYLAWAFFDKDGISARKEGDEAIDEEELESYLRRVEDVLGRPFEEGRGSATCLRLTIDEIHTRYRSVVWYGIVSVVDTFTHLCFLWNGFQYRAQPLRERLAVFPPRLLAGMSRHSSEVASLPYWYRPHTAAGKTPLVFLHGIGIGLLTYKDFLASVAQPVDDDGGQIGIMALEILPISMRLTSEPLSRPEFLRQVGQLLAHHGWNEFVLVSHSYGSVLTTHMVRSPELGPRIKSLVMIDPVSIMLHLPDVAYNFTRREPRLANEWQLWFFASMDPGVAHTLGRHFFWRENIVWKEELTERLVPTGNGQMRSEKRKVAVSLGGRDLIVNTTAVERYLQLEGDLGVESVIDESTIQPLPIDESVAATRYQSASGVEVFFFRQLDHAQAFDGAKEREILAKLVRSHCGA